MQGQKADGGFIKKITKTDTGEHYRKKLSNKREQETRTQKKQTEAAGINRGGTLEEHREQV